MEHQYIEMGIKKLYSVYNSQDSKVQKQAGVILCYPIGQEYIRCHKLYVNLAKKLAENGFHILRFDYSGTGDSSGEFSSFNIKEGIEDIGIAVKELREACGVDKIYLVGVRLGATLSLLYSQKANVDGLILWNPIFYGNKYLMELKNTYKDWLSGSFANENIVQNGNLISFGFKYSSILIEQLKSLKITKKDFPLDLPILLIENEIPNDLKELSKLFFVKNINVQYWLKQEDESNKSMVPIHELNETINWLKCIG